MRFIFAALWLVTVSFVSTANAVPVDIVYTGLASGYTNYTPFLCGIDCSFTNVPFMLTYQFNVPAGATSFSNSYVDTAAHSIPGFVYGTPTATASINIGGVFGSIVPDQANSGGTPIPGARDESIAAFPGGISQSIGQTLGYHQPGIWDISTSASNPLIPDSLFASYFISSGLGGSGNFQINIGGAGGMYGTLALDAIYVNGGIAAFPEPSTWAMLLIGFAAIGFTGYRKRSQRAIVAIGGAIHIIKQIGEIARRCG